MRLDARRRPGRIALSPGPAAKPLDFSNFVSHLWLWRGEKRLCRRTGHTIERGLSSAEVSRTEKPPERATGGGIAPGLTNRSLVIVFGHSQCRRPAVPAPPRVSGLGRPRRPWRHGSARFDQDGATAFQNQDSAAI